MDLKFNVPEISCDHCKNTIEELLNSQENIDSAVVDVQKKEVFVSSSNQVSIDELKTLLDDHGYTVVE
jgi:copper chaperone CopZ|tara:strand:+ start:673 stop:876 length:204 start_codon:yes stop_codon:yes gene_type:complete